MASRQVESRYITTSTMYIRKNGEQGVRKRVVVYAVQLDEIIYMIELHFDFNTTFYSVKSRKGLGLWSLASCGGPVAI